MLTAARSRLVPLVLGVALAAAGCGTRLPASAFRHPSAPPSGSGSTAAPAGTGGPVAGSPVAGVTSTTITIGTIASTTNPFDPQSFVGPTQGLEAFVHWTNAHGGVHGRRLVLDSCDDQGSGDRNNACVHRLLDRDKVFALASTAILDYAGAAYVNARGVPDVGSQPIDVAYTRYRHLWDLYGEDYPRNDRQYGFRGRLYGGTEVYRYFATRFPRVPKVAGVVEYNQGASERYGASIAAGLRLEGYRVDEKVVNFALPDYDSVAIDFRSKGVQYVYDAIDSAGNERLCQALDDNRVRITAKVVTTQSWDQSVATDYRSAPRCRNALWATGDTRNYADTRYPEVAAFRRQLAADGHTGPGSLSEWALEGWAGGLWLADAISSCGATVTRACVERYVNTGPRHPYDGHGLLTPRYFAERSAPPATARSCLNVARWQDSAGTWVTQVPDMNRNCFTVPQFGYPAT